MFRSLIVMISVMLTLPAFANDPLSMVKCRDRVWQNANLLMQQARSEQNEQNRLARFNAYRTYLFREMQTVQFPDQATDNDNKIFDDLIEFQAALQMMQMSDLSERTCTEAEKQISRDHAPVDAQDLDPSQRPATPTQAMNAIRILKALCHQ